MSIEDALLRLHYRSYKARTPKNVSRETSHDEQPQKATGKKGRAVLKKQTSKRKQERYAAFDLETNGLGGPFLVANVVFCDALAVDNFFFSVDTLLAFIFAHPTYTYLCHNASSYDFSYIVQTLYDTYVTNEWTIEPTLQGKQQRMIALTCTKDKKKFRMIDTLAVFPATLKQFTAALLPTDEQKQDIGLASGVTYDHTNATHRDYLHADCASLIRAMQELETRVWEAFGSNIKLTAGSTAMAAWLASFDEDECYFRQTEEVETFCERGYKGGYVFGGRTALPQHECSYIDCNAMYGSVMRDKPFPVGRAIYTSEFQTNSLGMYECRILARNVAIPLLSVKTKEGNALLGNGSTATTVLTSPEIEWGRTHGYIIEVMHGYYWCERSRLFEKFMRLCETLEFDARLKPVAKLMRNSLYGKFGTKKQVTRMKFCTALQEGMDVVVRDDGIPLEHVYSVEEVLDVPYIQYHWAAFVTAYARLHLAATIERIGAEHCYYSDTDSIVCSRGALATSGIPLAPKGYGLFKLEKELDVFVTLGAKKYLYKVAGCPEWNATIKGVNVSAFSQTDLQDIALRRSDILQTRDSVRKPLWMLHHADTVLLPQYSASRSVYRDSLASKWHIETNGDITLQRVTLET